MNNDRSVRKHPVHGVFPEENSPTIVFLTVCAKDRQPWLASERVHGLLVETWQGAMAWLVGRYVVLPDHLHLFCAPNGDLSLETWVRYWKSQFTKAIRRTEPQFGGRWQTDHWDTRLRRSESYDEKWLYVRNNPVRHGLVETADAWPFQGELNELRWD